MTDLSLSISGASRAIRKLDRVWLTIIGLFVVLALVSPPQALASAAFTADAFLWLLPFLLVSVILAAWLKAAGADRLIGATVSQSVYGAIFLAAAAGAFSPFCSCGVVPLIAALLAAGVPLPVVMAFWLASPIMDPEMFVLMWASVGLELTLAKTAAALGLGLFGGFATLGLERAGFLVSPLKAAVSCGGCGSKGLAPVNVEWAVWRDPVRRKDFLAEGKVVALFLAKWLVLAFAIESLMVAYLPADLIATHLGGNPLSAVPLAVVLGVPAYLNGYAAIPLIGGLLDLGMAPGAALAFLVAGGVTSLPAAMAVFALVRGSVFALYLVLAAIGSLVAGFGYQAWIML